MSADLDNAQLPIEERTQGRETAESMRQRICHSYPADRYAVLFEVRNATGVSVKRRDGYCDAMVMGLWPSRGLELWGMEIKVSRSDWLRELKRPEKCEEFFRYCHRWFVVAPEGVVKLEELPPTWGLMVPSREGLRATVAGKQLEPQPADVGLLASICRSAANNWKQHPEYVRAREQMDADVERLVASKTEHRRATMQKMAVLIAEFQVASGVTICDSYTLGEAIKHLPNDDEARKAVAAAIAISDRGNWYTGVEKIGSAVKLILDGGLAHMRERLATMIKTSRNVADSAERSLAEFDAKGGA